jgi:hypothetical protein
MQQLRALSYLEHCNVAIMVFMSWKTVDRCDENVHNASEKSKSTQMQNSTTRLD